MVYYRQESGETGLDEPEGVWNRREIRTEIWRVDAAVPDPDVIRRAAEVIRGGGLVAFPTETVYGLGANALDGRAVRRIFQVKGRPADNPLIVHVAGVGEVKDLVAELSPVALRLAERFWPGPLTLILPAASRIPREVTAGLDTVAVRMPAHAVALALIRAAGVPIAAPSANTSGRPSPTTAAHVAQDLGGKIEVILDGGPAPVGVESTVLDLTSDLPTILRPGGVTAEELAGVLGAVKAGPGETPRPRSPGMKYRHYAPRGTVILVEGEPAVQVLAIRELARRHAPRRVVVLAADESAPSYAGLTVVRYGPRANLREVARQLYGALRRCDELGAEIILAEATAREGLGLAVSDRLRRAAAQVVRAQDVV